IELDGESLKNLPKYLQEGADYFFHLLWGGGRYDFAAQQKNIRYTITAVEIAAQLGCKRILCTGSQAEYGAVKDELILEERRPLPYCAYGAAKTAAYYMGRYRAEELGIEWIWGRIFSLIGRYEPQGRMLPDLVLKLKENKDVQLSSCLQNWDYLDASDAAEAMIALAEKGKSGEIYNIANGNYHPLRYYVEQARVILGSESKVFYGKDPEPYISLQPSVEKIRRDTGWMAVTGFADSIAQYSSIG
ncbi:MAG: NAD-dependent epimerase/dehydratase family protein, partial [Lachnospiraceae bacterium]|nr:NAD-dependent epimerase/dehydratase family protein [Lachnospiraceae bacterium]